MENLISQLFDTFQTEPNFRYCPQERKELLDRLDKIEQEFRTAGEEKTLSRFLEATDTWGSLSVNEGTNAFLCGLTLGMRLLLLILPLNGGTAESP